MQIGNVNLNQNFNGIWETRKYSEIKPAPFVDKLAIYYITEDIYHPSQNESEDEICKAIKETAPIRERGKFPKQISSDSLRFKENRLKIGTRLSE